MDRSDRTPKTLLTNQKKSELIKLLDLDSEAADDLFKNIEYQLKECWIPDDISSSNPSRKVIAKEKTALLKDISNASKKLEKLLLRLDDTLRRNIDGSIGGELGRPYESETVRVGGKPAMVTDSISSKDAARIISDKSEQLKYYIENNYAHGYMERAIVALGSAWRWCSMGKITLSSQSKFVSYICIILDIQDHERVFESVKRSNWYKEIKELQKGE